MRDVSVQQKISSVCDSIKELLLAKNAKYGNSALDPIRVFSTSSAEEQVLVRIDDKLSRIKRGAGLLAADEDVIDDLIGYLVLYKVITSSKVEPNYDEIVKFCMENYDYIPHKDSCDYEADYRCYGGTAD